MKFNASIGVCRRVEDSKEVVIIPKEPDLYENNDLVIVIKSEDFFKISDDMSKLIKFIEDVKNLEDLDVNK
ncbi:MAG: hypothetical protein KO217_05005 [Methanobacteriaceae archaeon]|nr:hypothetical protein [Methanobacteriaceae archaeon]